MDIKDLYFITFEEYLKLHPELIKYDKNYKLKLYNHMEINRKKNIENAIKKRRQLINFPIENEKKDSLLKKSYSALSLKDDYFTELDEEKEKMRQMLVLKSKINYELKLSEREEKNKKRYLNQEKTIGIINQYRQKLKNEKLLKEQISEMQRKERLKLDYEEYLKYLDEIKQKEHRIYNNVEKTLKEKNEENEIRKKMSKQKEDDFRVKYEKKIDNENKNIDDKREKLRLKYEIQNKNLNEIRREKNIENQEKSKITEKKSIKAFICISQNETDNYNIKTNKMNKKNEIVNENKKEFSRKKL